MTTKKLKNENFDVVIATPLELSSIEIPFGVAKMFFPLKPRICLCCYQEIEIVEINLFLKIEIMSKGGGNFNKSLSKIKVNKLFLKNLIFLFNLLSMDFDCYLLEYSFGVLYYSLDLFPKEHFYHQ